MNFFSGYKTYILAVIGLILVILGYFGVIDMGLVDKILILLGIGTAVSIRAAIGKAKVI